MSHGNECRPSLHCIAVPISLRVRGFQRRWCAGDVIHSPLWIAPVPSTSPVNTFESHVISEDLLFLLYRRAKDREKLFSNVSLAMFVVFLKRLLFWLLFLRKLPICFWLTSVHLCSNLCRDLYIVTDALSQTKRWLRRCMTTKRFEMLWWRLCPSYVFLPANTSWHLPTGQQCISCEQHNPADYKHTFIKVSA